MKPHRLSSKQRAVLVWMDRAVAMTYIETGHKSTTKTDLPSGEIVIRCQSVVPYFLLHHGYIERAAGICAYQLTDKGKAAIS